MAEFEELRLTVNLTDNTSAGLARLRQEVGQLTQMTTRMTTNLAGASSGVVNLGHVVQQNAPAMRSLKQEVTALNRSAENLGRGLVEMTMAMGRGGGGVAALPQMAEGFFNAASGLRGMAAGLRVLAPAMATAGIAVAGTAVAVTAGAAAFVAYSIFAFKFAKEMDTLARTGKALGTSFGEVKNMTNVARQYGMQTEVLINNLAGLQKAQTDLHQNGSRLRSELLAKGMDPKWIKDIANETEAWRASNMVRDKGLQIEKELIAKGWNPRAARGMINEMAQMMGFDKGIFDRKPMKPLDPATQRQLDEVERMSRDISEKWGDIGDQIEAMKLEVLAAGLPLVRGILKWVDENIDRVLEWFRWGPPQEAPRPVPPGQYGPRQGPAPVLPHLLRPRQQSFQGSNDNSLFHRASFTTERLVEDTEENTSQLEKLTSQLEKINAYFDYSRSVGSGTGGGGAGAGAGRGGGAAGARGGGAGGNDGTGSGGNVSMTGGEQLASGYFAPITSNKAGGGLGGHSASMGAGAHGGDDLMAPHGSSVHAIKDGKVVRYGRDNQGGMTMTVRHNDGTTATYMHLSKRIAPINSPVRGGETIGASGTANGVPHLHFEMRNQKGQRISPRDELGVTAAARAAEKAKQAQQPPKPAEPEKRSDIGGGGGSNTLMGGGGKLYDPEHGWIIGTGNAHPNDPLEIPGGNYPQFRRSENVSDERSDMIRGAGRQRLAQRLGMSEDQRRRRGEDLLIQAHAVGATQPNQLSADLGMNSLLKMEKTRTKEEEWKNASEIADWSQYDRGALDSGRASIDDMRTRGKFRVNVTAPPGTEVSAKGGGLFKNPEMQRTTEIPYNGTNP